MARYDSADLLRVCRLTSGRPAADADMTSDRWYEFLTQAQEHWAEVIATHVPAAMFDGDPAALIPSEHHRVWMFAGEPEIIGRIELRHGQWGEKIDSADYIQEGNRVIFRTHSPAQGTVWGRYVSAPREIGPNTQPSLLPIRARILLVYHACSLEAGRGGMKDPAAYLAQAQKLWMGDPMIEGDVGLLEALQKQYREESSTGRRYIYPPPRR